MSTRPIFIERLNLALQDEADLRQEIVFLALDLISGRMMEIASLYAWLLRNGLSGERISRGFKEHAVELPFIGINLYPMFTDKKLIRNSAGRTAHSHALRAEANWSTTRADSTGNVIARRFLFRKPRRWAVCETEGLAAMIRSARRRGVTGSGCSTGRIHLVASLRTGDVGLSARDQVARFIFETNGLWDLDE